MSELDIPCYIARCRCGCGALIFASVDEPEQSQKRRADTAKEIADLVRNGFTIERMPVGEVRSANWKCTSKAGIVCRLCTAPTRNINGFCDACLTVDNVDVEHCLLCERGYACDKGGCHTNAAGGYVGKCTLTSNSCASEKT